MQLLTTRILNENALFPKQKINRRSSICYKRIEKLCQNNITHRDRLINRSSSISIDMFMDSQLPYSLSVFSRFSPEFPVFSFLFLFPNSLEAGRCQLLLTSPCLRLISPHNVYASPPYRERGGGK